MLSAGNMFHIYNRAKGAEQLFREEKNYSFFLAKLYEHVIPVAEIFSWCLLSNHFHLMIRVRSPEKVAEYLGEDVVRKAPTFDKLCSKRFSNFFSSYAQAYNKVYSRRGNLFQANMKHKLVAAPRYFEHLLLYIHRNAAKHGFVADFREWPHSSWFQYIADATPGVPEYYPGCISAETKSEVFNWFGSKAAFIAAHSSAYSPGSTFKLSES